MSFSDMPINDLVSVHSSWFSDITVEPIPSVKEYGEKMPEEDRLSFVDASVRQWAYHTAREIDDEFRNNRRLG